MVRNNDNIDTSASSSLESENVYSKNIELNISADTAESKIVYDILDNSIVNLMITIIAFDDYGHENSYKIDMILKRKDNLLEALSNLNLKTLQEDNENWIFDYTLDNNQFNVLIDSGNDEIKVRALFKEYRILL